MNRNLRIAGLACLVMSVTPCANAGIYSDDLSRCLVESATPADKTALVRWMFSAMSLHPEVRDMATVSTEDIEKSSEVAANSFVTLLTETCKTQAAKAVKYEGAFAIQQGFTVFGQVAGQELFANPEVSRGIAGLEKYMDTDRINEALELK